MTEYIVIRLGRDEKDPVHWLMWSITNDSPVVEGRLSNALQLNELIEHCRQRKVYVLAPGNCITYHCVSLPGRINRKSIQALPFLIEESIASDVEKLHITQVSREQGTFHLAVVELELVQQWLAWLLDAGIVPYQMLPDSLALPFNNDGWHAVKLENQWLIRQNENTGMTVDSALLPVVLSASISPDVVYSYSELPVDVTGWQAVTPEAAMHLLAKQVVNSKVNLLTGLYKPQTEWQRLLRPWFATLSALAICLLLMLTNTLIEVYQINRQADVLKSQTVELYRQLFPGQRNIINPRQQMEQQINQLKQQAGANNFITLLGNLQPILKQAAPIELKTMRFDEKQNELRFTASVKSFDTFEQLRQALTEHYQVQQLDLNERGGKVEGTIIIRDRK